jgi:hypothetical protein
MSDVSEIAKTFFIPKTFRAYSTNSLRYKKNIRDNAVDWADRIHWRPASPRGYHRPRYGYRLDDYSADRASLNVLDGRITAVVFSASGR